MVVAWGHTCCPPPVTSGLTLPIAPRPASMDLLHPHWLEVSRNSPRPQAAPSAFPPQQLPGALCATALTLSIGPKATCSNVGLPAISRASLAASPVVGTRLTTSRHRPGPWARPVLAEYASIQKLKGTDLGPQELQQRKAKMMPDAQVRWARVGHDGLGRPLAKQTVRTPPWVCSHSPGGYPVLQGLQA